MLSQACMYRHLNGCAFISLFLAATNTCMYIDTSCMSIYLPLSIYRREKERERWVNNTRCASSVCFLESFSVKRTSNTPSLALRLILLSHPPSTLFISLLSPPPLSFSFLLPRPRICLRIFNLFVYLPSHV